MDQTTKASAVQSRVGTSSMSTANRDSNAARRMRSFSPLHPSEPDPRRNMQFVATATSAPASSYPPPPAPHSQRRPDFRYHDIPAAADTPLINLVTNEWMKSSPGYSDLLEKEEYYEEDEYGTPIIPKTKGRRFYFWPARLDSRTTIRCLAIYVILLFACFSYWKGWLKRDASEEDLLDASLYRASLPGHQSGTNAQPALTDMIHLRYLDSQYVPGASHASKKRLIVVGDVHGCRHELEELIKKIAFNSKHDHIIFAGDMIFKGPDSPGTIDYIRSLEASCVRGNHEDRTLLAYASLHKKTTPLEEFGLADGKDDAAVEDSNNPYAHGDTKHRLLAKQLSHDQIKWLKTCPVMLNVGAIDEKNFVVVHAGLQPGIRLEKQDPYSVMTMRTIDLDTRVPSEMRDGEPWEKVWNHYQKHVSSKIQRKTVIYGHDSRRGLSLKSYSRGIDSGCVTGGRLTALIINEKGKESTVSVKCRTNYRTIA